MREFGRNKKQLGKQYCEVFGASAAVIGGSIAAAGALGGAYIASQGAQSAANTQAGAANAASQLQYAEFQQQQQNLQPWLQAGGTALQTLEQGLQPGGQFNKPFTLADFQQDPAYNFQKNNITNATNAQGAAGGQRFSAATTSALQSNISGLSNQEYQTAFNNYMTQTNRTLGATESLANVGLSSTNNLNQLGGTMASNVGSNIVGAGNAIAAGQVAGANAYGGALSTIGSTVNSGINTAQTNGLIQQWLNQQNPGGGGTPAAISAPAQPFSSPGTSV